MKVYGMMGINDENCVIKEPTETSIEKLKEYYLAALNKHSGKNIVLLHSNKVDSNTLGEILTAFLKSKYEIPAPYINIYLAKSLPKTTLQPTEANEDISHHRPTVQVASKSST